VLIVVLAAAAAAAAAVVVVVLRHFAQKIGDLSVNLLIQTE